MRIMGTGTGLARYAVAAVAGAAALLAADARAAVGASESVHSAAGAWDMSLNDTNRKCRLVLRPDPASNAYAIAMPAGCRRAMPILADVLGWTAATDGLELTDQSGTAVLQFTATTDPANLVAKGPEGETYNLVAADHGPHLEAVAQAAAAPAAGTPASPPATADTPAAAPAAADPASIPGRYGVFRAGNKDTGCQITLDPKIKGPKGGKKANLAPACRDQGIVIFDPAGWRFEKGTLVLTAKKGHETHLVLQPDGSWQKDPKDGGATLILKKV